MNKPLTTVPPFRGFDSFAVSEDRGEYSHNVVLYTTALGSTLMASGYGTTYKQQRAHATAMLARFRREGIPGMRNSVSGKRAGRGLVIHG